MSWRLFCCLVLTALAGVAHADSSSPARIASPDGRLQVELSTDGEGRPSWRAERDGHPLIAPSRLGMLFADMPKFERNLALTAHTTGAHDGTWTQPWGERHTVRDHHRELRATFTEQTGAQRRFDVVVRVFDDGIGFRYDIPRQPGLERLEIVDELTEFAVAPTATAWWLPALEWNREEYLYARTPLTEVGRVQTPITLRTDEGTHLSLHEAALVDYPAMNLARVDGQRLRADLTPGISQARARVSTPFATPWRVLLVTDTATALADSSLILNLNEPNALDDVSWVRPMKYVGIWWEMHLGTKTWASGPDHGATTRHAIDTIDFAAEHGLEGVLIEGWNVGWDGDWFGNGESFSFTEPYPDFDLERVAAHARERGVQLIGHHETSGHAAHYEEQMDDAFALYERLGVGAVKTGYVADGGQAKVRDEAGHLRYAWHESQAMVQHHDRVVRAAARHRIAVNPHEPVKDTGLRRTWPNLITREGARGMEYNAWGLPGNPPEHEATLAFTRMLAGPMDFTPGVFAMRTRSGAPMATTLAKQLALYVVIYSPLQMAADLPDHYRANLPAFRFIQDVPVDWADSRALAGEVGEYAVFARRDRHSEDWYLGAVTDAEARTVEVALDFLAPGQRYRAHVYRDGPGAGFDADQTDIVIEQHDVDAGRTLSLALARGGGQAIRFEALPDRP
ncbi:glycoside hydrolase family 97 protein [Luteimonas abyssi]|uniref:glycoside hydrolase family 97 protein n=1 Tax=Luteimonas abyssi TaxID=1247514 RepID=UPI000B1075BC|nr:glycoside hydrolase family 97 protein [Luteimonas abyssi]